MSFWNTWVGQGLQDVGNAVLPGIGPAGDAAVAAQDAGNAASDAGITPSGGLGGAWDAVKQGANWLGTPPTGPTLDPSYFAGGAAPGWLTPNTNDPQALAAQQQLLQQLQDQANGKGPSLATMQLQQATDQNMRQQAGLAAGGRTPGLASYQAMQNQGAMGQQFAGQSAQARLMEQMQARQQLAGLAGQMQGQAMGTAQLGQQGNEFYDQQQQAQRQAYQNYLYQNGLQQQQQAADMKKALIGGAFNAMGSATGDATKMLGGL